MSDLLERWAALVGWASYCLSIALLWAQHRIGVLHPYSLLFLVLLAVTLGCALYSLSQGAWRLIRGPRRRPAAAWVALGVGPVVLWSMLAGYGVRQSRRHESPHNVAWRVLSMATASVMELQARYGYSHRLETEHLVMIYDDRVTTPERDAEAMEKHVARLVNVTGLPLREKIYWVRGELIGMGRMAVSGLALGSSHSPRDWVSADHPQNLSVDRHELAHAVLHQAYKPDTNPPTLLVEGWAESQSGRATPELASSALESRAEWRARTNGGHQASYLKELVGPARYHHIDGPVYSVGGALADFLLRKYGVERFLKLYFTCTPETFEADWRRSFGADLDAVESDFWKEAESLARPAGS